MMLLGPIMTRWHKSVMNEEGFVLGANLVCALIKKYLVQIGEYVCVMPGCNV